MKRRIFVVFLLLLVGLLVFFNTYSQEKFNMNVLEYFSNPDRLTLREKQWLKENGPIIYGSNRSAPPWSFLDASNQYAGVVVDYINALSLELGVDIKIELSTWNEALMKLERGETNLCDMYPSEERSKKYIFSDPIFYQRGILVLGKDNTSISGLSDLEGETLAIQKGDFIEEFLTKRLDNIHFVYVKDLKESLILLSQGLVTGTAGDEPVMTYYMKEMDLVDELKIMQEPLYEMPTVLSIPKDQEILKGIIDKGIFRLKQKETMLNIQRKWFGIAKPIIQDGNESFLSLVFKIIILLLVSSLVLSYFWNKELQQKVKEKVLEINLIMKNLDIIFNSITTPLVVLNKQLEITNGNDALFQLLDKEREEIIHSDITRHDPMSKIDFKLLMEEAIEHNAHINYEFSINRKIYKVRSFNMKDSNEVLFSIEDVSERRKKDNQMMHMKKMIALGQLSAGVAHELRNPLGLIRNHIFVIKNKIYASEEEYTSSIQTIEDSLESANHYIDNLLNFSRISSEHKEEIPLKNFFEELIMIKKRELEKNNISMKLECQEKISCFFNRESFKHIFLNLISNAIDAIINNGEIKIKCHKNDQGIYIKVMDDGQGISPENLEKIYDPFFTTKYPDNGTGLGLNIVYKEIEQANGSIDVESELGKGTVFSIFLPTEGYSNE